MIFSEDDNFDEKRKKMVKSLERSGAIESDRIKEGFLSVKRENFMDPRYKSESYHPHNPYPIPGKEATISAPDTYALIYESLNLKRGDELLEVGTGSGYGAALAKEIVGEEGDVTSIELDKKTYEFAKKNLKNYEVEIIKADGRKGYEQNAPYDKIVITAATKSVPDPLRNQLRNNGKIIAPIGQSRWSQTLTLYEKKDNEFVTESITGVRYVELRKSK